MVVKVKEKFENTRQFYVEKEMYDIMIEFYLILLQSKPWDLM